MNNAVASTQSRLPAILVALFCTLLFTVCLVYGIYGRYIYFASLMVVFFLPSSGLGYYVWTRGDRWYRTALFAVLSISFGFSVAIEFVAVYLKFWVFFTDKDPLLRCTVGGIPVEEFIFYFGANMQLCLLYTALRLKCERMGITSGKLNTWVSKEQAEGKLPSDVAIKRLVYGTLAVLAVIIGAGLYGRFRKENGSAPKQEYRDKRGRPVYIEGQWYPGWLIAIVPFAVIGLQWFFSVLRKIHLPAFLISVSLNVTMYLLFEYNAIMRGHWVYNEQRLLGWRLAGTIPLEQIILYFVSFLFLIPFFETMRSFLIGTFGTDVEKQRYAQSINLPQKVSFMDCKKLLSSNTTENADDQ